MGKTIVSWSPIHGQGATTSNVAALSSLFAQHYDSSSLIMNTELIYSPLEFLFGKFKTKSRGFEESGTEALELLIKSNLLKPIAIRDYTETIYPNKLDILGNSKNDGFSNEQLLGVLLDAAKDAYDLVWIDAHAGNRNEMTKNLLRRADLVIVNLPQNYFVLERFFSGEDYPSELSGKDIVILISQYDQNSTLNVRKIIRKYKIDYPVFPMYYSYEYKDACNLFNISEFFYRNQVPKKEQTVFKFIEGINKVNKMIAKKMEVDKYEEDDDE